MEGNRRRLGAGCKTNIEAEFPSKLVAAENDNGGPCVLSTFARFHRSLLTPFLHFEASPIQTYGSSLVLTQTVQMRSDSRCPCKPSTPSREIS